MLPTAFGRVGDGGGSDIGAGHANQAHKSLQFVNIHSHLQADASGTVEAVKAALGALPQDSVLLRFLLAAPNQITTSDVDLAAASEAVILGFNVEPSEEVAAAAKEKSAP